MKEEENVEVVKETKKRGRPKKVSDAKFEETKVEPKVTKKEEEKKEVSKKETKGKKEVEDKKIDVSKEEETKKPRKRKRTTKPKEEVVKETPTEEVKEEVSEVTEESSSLVPAVVLEPEEAKEEEVIPEVTPLENEVTPVKKIENPIVKSYFDGRFLEYVGWSILGFIVTVATFGLGSSFARCFMLKWQYSHTVINGRRLDFDGNGFQLLGKYLLWVFLTVITLGIYGIWLPVQYNKWVVKHTHYAGNLKPVNNNSVFTGKTIQIFLLSVLCGLLNICSLGILYPFTENLLFAWRINHTIYDNNQMQFDGKGFQLLGNFIKWGFFSIITLGIYRFWIPINMIRWEVKHTNNKGMARHPYKPVLAMLLPTVLVISLVGFGIYSLLQVPEETWKNLGNDIKAYVDDFNDEIDVKMPGYDPEYAIARRIGDVFYMIRNNDYDIGWDDRYTRFFNNSKYANKFAYNGFGKRGNSNDGGMALIDINSSDKPVAIINNGNVMTFYWIINTRVEEHYFASEEDVPCKLVYVIDSKNKSRVAVQEYKKDGVRNYYYYNYTFIDDLADMDTDFDADISYISANDKNKELAKKGYTVAEAEIDFVPIAFKSVKYGYKIDEDDLENVIEKYKKTGSFDIKYVVSSKKDIIVEDKKEEETKEEEKEEDLKKEEKEVKNLKAGNYTLDFGTYKSSNTDVTGGFYSIKADGTYTYTNSNVLEKGKRVTVNENGKYEIKNMVFDEDKDTGEIYSKGWAICMTSSAKTKRSEACWQISQSNSFQAINSSNTWTLQK